jgi:CrcB protein
MMANYFIIGLGGFLGAVARYIVALWIGQKWGRIFPLGTFVVNIRVVSSLLCLFSLKVQVSPQLRLFLAIGFSCLYHILNTNMKQEIVKDGEWFIALANVILSITLGLQH